MSKPRHIPLALDAPEPHEMLRRAEAFRNSMTRRRTVRDFSSRPVARAVIEACLATAGSAPSGANLQPWQFVAVNDADLKQRIRTAAEAEERAFYGQRAPREWLEALAPLGTDADKPFLTTAPWLIAIFQQRHGTAADGTRVKHYYAPESVGIATGILIAALHQAGLATLTHTPSPMGFLNDILDRPRAERPFLLLVAAIRHRGRRCRTSGARRSTRSRRSCELRVVWERASVWERPPGRDSSENRDQEVAPTGHSRAAQNGFARLR